MMKLLKADLYKIVKGKLFWILSALILGLSLLGVHNSYHEANFSYNSVRLFPPLPKLFFWNAMGFYISILLTVFSSVFVVREFSFGTIKTIIGKGFDRTKFYFSKLMSSIFVFFFFALLNMATVFTYSYILTQGKMEVETDQTIVPDWFYKSASEYFHSDIKKSFTILGLQFLICFAWVFVIVAVASVLRSNASALSLGLIAVACGAVGIQKIINPLVNNILGLPKTDWVMLDLYWLFSSLNRDMEVYGQIPRIIIVCLCYIVASAIICVWDIRSRDIK